MMLKEHLKRKHLVYQKWSLLTLPEHCEDSTTAKDGSTKSYMVQTVITLSWSCNSVNSRGRTAYSSFLNDFQPAVFIQLSTKKSFIRVNPSCPKADLLVDSTNEPVGVVSLLTRFLATCYTQYEIPSRLQLLIHCCCCHHPLWLDASQSHWRKRKIMKDVFWFYIFLSSMRTCIASQYF